MPTPTPAAVNGGLVLVLGILSIVICGLCGPFAWVLGNRALAAYRRDPRMDQSGRSLVTAGRICGIIGTAFMALSTAFQVFAYFVPDWPTRLFR